MISVAEESGKLDAELVRIAVVTEADLDRNLKTAVAFAEPLMLFLIAGVHRHHFHRHVAADVLHERIHQIKFNHLTNHENPTPNSETPKSETRRRAFTLVEMLLVVTIIGILAALVIPKIAGRSEQARADGGARRHFGGIKTALDAYEVDNGFYPKSLQDLIQQPSNAKNWHGPYLDKLPHGSVGQSLRLLLSRQTQPQLATTCCPSARTARKEPTMTLATGQNK